MSSNHWRMRMVMVCLLLAGTLPPPILAWRFPSWLATASVASNKNDQHTNKNANKNKNKTTSHNKNNRKKKSWWQDADFEKYPTTPTKSTSKSSSSNSNKNDDDLYGLSKWQLEPLLQIPCGIGMVPADRSLQDLQQELSWLEDDDDDDHNDSDDILEDRDHPTKVAFDAVTTMLDTGAQRTVLSQKACQRLGLTRLLDRRYAGAHATSVVGDCRVVGRIPAHTVALKVWNDDDDSVFLVPLPAVTVLESDHHDDHDHDDENVELLLGLDLLRELKATIDLEEEHVRWKIRSDDQSAKPRIVRISFVRPRAKISFDELMDQQQADRETPQQSNDHDKPDTAECQDDTIHNTPDDDEDEDDDDHIEKVQDVDTRPHILLSPKQPTKMDDTTTKKRNKMGKRGGGDDSQDDSDGDDDTEDGDEHGESDPEEETNDVDLSGV